MRVLGTCGPRQRSFQTVSPRLRVDVVVDGELGAADLDGLALLELRGAALVPLEPDELELVRLVREFGARLVVGHHATHEALALSDDAGHLLVERLEVLGGERLGDVEVVVEPVGHGRSDAELRLGVDGLHGLREHVRGRVAQDAEAVGRVDRDRFDDVGVGHRRGEVLELAVDAHRDNGSIGEELEAVGHCDPLPLSRDEPFNCSATPRRRRPSRQPTPARRRRSTRSGFPAHRRRCGRCA